MVLGLDRANFSKGPAYIVASHELSGIHHTLCVRYRMYHLVNESDAPVLEA